MLVSFAIIDVQVVPLMECVCLLKDLEVLHLMEQHAMNSNKNRPKHDHYRRAVAASDGPQREVRKCTWKNGT